VPVAPGAPGAEVVVHVAGAVARPGVQRLVGGDRVIDAVDAAGGAVPDADLGRINLAAPLVDGQQIYVPRVGEVPPPAVGGTGAIGTTAGGTATAPGQPVNLNTASAAELETLPGVGPTTAAAIIAHRETNGPFTAVDQLLDVRGIGDAKLAQLRDLVAV
jgi:competence protein ComEA